jgi:hypothetical protein
LRGLEGRAEDRGQVRRLDHGELVREQDTARARGQELRLLDLVHLLVVRREEHVGLRRGDDLPREIARGAEVEDQVHRVLLLVGRLEGLQRVARARGGVDRELDPRRSLRRSLLRAAEREEQPGQAENGTARTCQ